MYLGSSELLNVGGQIIMIRRGLVWGVWQFRTFTIFYEVAFCAVALSACVISIGLDLREAIIFERVVVGEILINLDTSFSSIHGSHGIVRIRLPAGVEYSLHFLVYPIVQKKSPPRM